MKEYKGREAEARSIRSDWKDTNYFFKNVGTVDELRAMKKSASNAKF